MNKEIKIILFITISLFLCKCSTLSEVKKPKKINENVMIDSICMNLKEGYVLIDSIRTDENENTTIKSKFDTDPSKDTSLIKIKDCYSFYDDENYYFQNSKEVAIEVEIDREILNKVYVSEGLFDDDDFDYFLFLEKDKSIAQNQNYLWNNSQGMVHGLILNAVHDSVNQVNLTLLNDDYSEKKLNDFPLQLVKGTGNK